MPSRPEHAYPPLGVIEGFFGRAWSWAARHDMVTFMALNGYDYYLYAPKADPYLRRQWRQDWPDTERKELQALREHCRAEGLRFGVGLSPLELYREAWPESRTALTARILELNSLEPDLLGLLFDDMRGDVPELAERQVALAHAAAEASCAEQVILCPTYYSFDPILEKVFGTRPERYWQQLGQELDPGIDIFWTGPQVCSAQYPKEHLNEVTDLLGRKPFLWDNYPVNDSARLAPHLRLDAYPAAHGELSGRVSGHAVNPMNQAYLSQIPLCTLPQAYRLGADYRPRQAFLDACHQQCPQALADCLIADRNLLQERGLEQLDVAHRSSLKRRYQPFAAQGQPQALELLDWLNDGYTFDPACLTD